MLFEKKRLLDLNELRNLIDSLNEIIKEYPRDLLSLRPNKIESEYIINQYLKNYKF